jgi:hypothetical protein
VAPVIDSPGDSNDAAPRGATLLPRDLTPAQLESAPLLASADSLVIDELTDREYEDFLAALRS